ncbi:MAG: phosphatase PAP2 family protein [Vicinamibacterales bacterium]
MPSTRTLLLTAVAITLGVGLQARLLPYLPGDIAVAQAFQAISPGTAWVPVMVSTATAPTKYLLMAIALLGAWRLAGTRALAVVAVAIVLEQIVGEPSKLLFGRPRPSRELVAVMGTPSGLSFPSTFMTLYGVTVGALFVLAWRMRPSTRRTGVLAVTGLVLLVAAAARIVPGAHWPSDAFGTLAILLPWLALAFAAAGAERR